MSIVGSRVGDSLWLLCQAVDAKELLPIAVGDKSNIEASINDQKVISKHINPQTDAKILNDMMRNKFQHIHNIFSPSGSLNAIGTCLREAPIVPNLQQLKRSKYTNKCTLTSKLVVPQFSRSSLLKSELRFIPSYLFGAFNSGDMQYLYDIIESITTQTVTLKTKAMGNSIVGRFHILSFFEAFLDGHPDAYIVTTDVKFIAENTLTAAIIFKGTKALPSEKEYYFIKPRLVDNMDLEHISPKDISMLREFEDKLITQNKPIAVEFTGTMTLVFEDKTVSAVHEMQACSTPPYHANVDSFVLDRYPHAVSYPNILPLRSSPCNSLQFPEVRLPSSSKSANSRGSFNMIDRNSYFTPSHLIKHVTFNYHLMSFREAVIVSNPESPLA